MTGEPPHLCHARGCAAAVRPEFLMCGHHWRLVPRPIQNAVWAHYRAGQSDDKDVSRGWLQAADAAIGYVSRLEGRGLSKNETAAMAVYGLLPR